MTLIQSLLEERQDHHSHITRHMTNVYLTDSDKTSEHFKDKARKESLWEEFARSRKLSVKECKTWFNRRH